MLEAQNERRRRSGRPEITEEQVMAQVEEDERWKKELLDRYRRESEGDGRSLSLARVLIVGCGCRGRALAAELVAGGHAVRATTRRSEALAASPRWARRR